VLEVNSSTLRLVHFTAQEFFERLGPKLLPRADCRISRACLQYLSYDSTAYFSTTDDDLNTKLESFPLFEYAAGNWGTHVAKCTHSGCNLDDDVWEFLGDSRRVAGAVQGMLLPSQRHRGFSQDLVGKVTPSHLAAHFGLLKTIGTLLETETPDCRDDAGRTPLHWAARKGHAHIAKLLLDNAVEVDALDNVRATSLHLACRYGYHELASVLIANGSDVNAVNNVGGTALIWAALMGSLEIATLLLRHKADVHAMTNDEMTALGWAVDTENEAMVLLLIQHGAEVNGHVNNPRRSPLYLATRKRNEAIMRILLEAGAIPDIQTSQHDISKTTIGSAIMAKTDGPLRLLLEYGLDPNRRGASGENPIHYAVRLGNLATISTLVEFGGRLDSAGDNGNTVPHATVSEGNKENGGGSSSPLLGTHVNPRDSR
jgi:ankyrin repeat protein